LIDLDWRNQLKYSIWLVAPAFPSGCLIHSLFKKAELQTRYTLASGLFYSNNHRMMRELGDLSS